jgi:hypothetical protein
MVWYALVDCAQDPRLADLVKSCKESVCLFKGDVARSVADVSPWLVRMHDGDPLLGIWQEHGMGQNWGFMFLSSLSLKDLQTHFRKFLQVKLPDGTIALFRFYDPRVFNTFVKAAETTERDKFFKGISQFSVEREDGQGLHQYKYRNGQLLDDGAVIA